MTEKDLNTIRKEVDNYLNNLSENLQFSGSVLISIKGDLIINKGYGMANFELDVPNTAETKLRLASLTKQFTAAAILQLVERNLLSLEDTLDKFISDYPDGDKVTIHHLLNHSSGIFNHTNDENFHKFMRNRATIEELIDTFKNKPFDFNPGEKYSYSNSGYILLGYIIEKISGKTYEEFIQENIFDKIPMNNSGYDNHEKIIKNRAHGYVSVNGSFRNGDFIDMSIPYAAGALYSTVEDMHKWNNALFDEKVINRSSLDLMLKEHIKVEDNKYYGYGIGVSYIDHENNSIKQIRHLGGIPGFCTMNSFYPEYDIQIIILCNLITEKFQEIIDKVSSIVL